jgi:hypothetical protein
MGVWHGMRLEGRDLKIHHSSRMRCIRDRSFLLRYLIKPRDLMTLEYRTGLSYTSTAILHPSPAYRVIVERLVFLPEHSVVLLAHS